MKRTTPAASTKSTTVAKPTINMSGLHRELEQAAEELRSAEETAVHALNVRRAARVKHTNAGSAFEQAVAAVRTASTVSCTSQLPD